MSEGVQIVLLCQLSKYVMVVMQKQLLVDIVGVDVDVGVGVGTSVGVGVEVCIDTSIGVEVCVGIRGVFGVEVKAVEGVQSGDCIQSVEVCQFVQTVEAFNVAEVGVLNVDFREEMRNVLLVGHGEWQRWWWRLMP